MKFRILMLSAATALLFVSGTVFAGESDTGGGATTVTGEVVDLSCYLDHGAKGAKHAKCAQSCINKGLPMGLLTKDGKLYLLIEDHAKAEAYKAAKSKAAKTVTITGKAVSKAGIKGIAVQSVK